MKKFLIGITLFLASCGMGTSETPTIEGEQILVTHFSGSTYVPLNPSRIIMLDMAAFETLSYLGLSHKIVGTSTQDLTPWISHYSDIQNIGTMHNPNLELIVARDPDLIIISGRSRPMIDELSQIAPTIDLAINNAHFWEYFTRNQYYLSRIFGKEEEVSYRISNIYTLKNETRELAESYEGNALIVLYNNGALSAFGPSSRFGGLVHDTLGVSYVDENIEIVNHGAIISNEYIVEVNPDILLVIDRGAWAGLGNPQMNRADFENELIRLTEAYQNNNINYLDSVIWYLSPGGLRGVRNQFLEVQDALLSALEG